MAEIEVFLDTAYAIAPSSGADSHHEEAVSLARWIEASSIRLVTTRAVSLEIGSALAKARDARAVGIGFFRLRDCGKMRPGGSKNERTTTA